MTSREIRKKFLRYFEKKGHKIVPGSSLVPVADPTLLFTNAGMVQFKSAFLGDTEPISPRVASSQKCLRAGGKHNDLENVGRTHRHHTFFEMLGNFSFGDYFKEGAIEMAWEFLTRELNLPQDKLSVTVYEEDEEACRLWQEKVGLPGERIVRMGKEDNFWAMGETGPCGPCSEMVYDQGPKVGCGRPACGVGCDCDRFLELWNLVFMQYNRNEQGELSPLPKPSIDTGMGLERLAAVLQKVTSNYRTDLFLPILELIEEVSGKEYGLNGSWDISMQVIADHCRALAFLIAEGVLPENEGRGYVLRRILRRASRHARRLEISEPFLHRTALTVVDVMGPVYPELKARADHIAWVIQGEEERFNLTLDQGLKLLYDQINLFTGSGKKMLSGDFVFKLYDTFGFPLDLTQDIAREEGLQLDIEGFEAAMAVQRERARRHFKETVSREEVIWRDLAGEVAPTSFLGYETLEVESRVIKIIKDGQPLNYLPASESGEVLTEATPFYGGAGGQVGDVGEIFGPGCSGEVVDTVRPHFDLVVHRVLVKEGELKPGDKIVLKVDEAKRRATARNHTATHLLHSALRRILGNHVKQSGSLVAPDRLRFDFTHYSRLNEREITLIEELVNEMVWENVPVTTQVLSFDQALKAGALAFFGEKYGDKVRMVQAADFSRELCGGTHVTRTGDIGLFKITSEGAVAAGIRRVEALTGGGALAYLKQLEAGLKELAELSKTTFDPEAVKAKMRSLLDRNADLEKEMAKLKNRLARQEVEGLLHGVKVIGGIKVLAAQVPAHDLKELREYGDKVRDRLESGIILLAAQAQGQALLLAMVTGDLVEKFDAAHIIREAAKEMGASGGGRREMAQAGGGEPAKIQAAFARFYQLFTG